MTSAQQKQHSQMLAATIKKSSRRPRPGDGYSQPHSYSQTARSWSSIDGGDARDTIHGHASVYRGQYKEPNSRIYRDQDASRDVSRHAFRAAAGRSNHGLFSTFAYEHGRPATHPTGQDTKHVDKDGCPVSTHRGVTSLRHRIPTERTSIGAGSGVPAHNATLSGNKEWEWMPAPHVQQHISTLYRRMGEDKAGAASVSSAGASVSHPHGFRVGGPRNGALFDPSVRGLSRDHTYDVDKDLHGWIQDVAVKHQRPFAGNSVAKGIRDHSYLSGHPQFPYRASPYAPSERILVATQHHNTVGQGFRPDCNHLHQPTRVSGVVSHRASLTDRNPNYHSIQAENQMCQHACHEIKTHNQNTFNYTGAQRPN